MFPKAFLPATAENPAAAITLRREIVRVILEHLSCGTACRSRSGVVFESAFIVFDRRDRSSGPTAALLILYLMRGSFWPMARFMVEIFAVVRFRHGNSSPAP